MNMILVSECLYGARIVRYDGRDKSSSNPLFLKWKSEGRLIPVCPEILAGLQVPRAEVQRRGNQAVSINGEDLSDVFYKAAELTLAIAKNHDIAFVIFKENSPSCGVRHVYDGAFSGKKINKPGITTERLIAAGYKVFSDDEIDKAEQYSLLFFD